MSLCWRKTEKGRRGKKVSEMYQIWTLTGADEKGASTMYEVPTFQDWRCWRDRETRERERESQDCIPYLETNLTNRKRRTVDKTCTQCVHLTRHTNWVRLQCTYPRHLRTRGVGWIGRRKGCVGERERERVSCECTWWVDFREKEQIGCR